MNAIINNPDPIAISNFKNYALEVFELCNNEVSIEQMQNKLFNPMMRINRSDVIEIENKISELHQDMELEKAYRIVNEVGGFYIMLDSEYAYVDMYIK